MRLHFKKTNKKQLSSELVVNAPTNSGDLLYGAHSIIEALKGKRRKFISIYTTKPFPRSWERIKQHLPSQVPNIQYVSDNVLSSMCAGGKHMGVVAWFGKFPFRTKLFDPLNHPFILVLEGIQDVHNLGAILRSAFCTGVTGVVLSTKNSAPLTGGAHKASAGLAEHLDIFLTTSVPHTLQELKKAGYSIYLAVVTGGKEPGELNMTGPRCLVIGNEEKGIAFATRQEGALVTLSQRVKDSSYNASVAAGILMYLMSSKNANSN